MEYKVTKNGHIYGPRGELKGNVTKEGYIKLTLLDTYGKPHTVLKHRFIAACYLSDYSEELCVNHIDGDKTNNSVSNLEMCTQSYNVYHSCNTLHKGRIHAVTNDLDEYFYSIAEAERAYNIIGIRQSINKDCKCAGRKWRYASD